MISLSPSCDKCGAEHPLFFANQIDMMERLALDGWFADEIIVWCPTCTIKDRASLKMSLYPDHHPCPSCGRAIFMAIIHDKISYWNAGRDQNRGNMILYVKSTPQRIVMDKAYFRIDDLKHGDRPVFTSHRCRQRDRDKWRGTLDMQKAAASGTDTLTTNITSSSANWSSVITNYIVTSSPAFQNAKFSSITAP